MQREQSPRSTLVLGALGVVYGDIGTSPLYAIREAFTGYGIPPGEGEVLGILSLLFWALVIVVTLKYVLFMLRADNRGEGGIMALTALVLQAAKGSPRRGALAALGLFGAALFYGEGVITPAISVLSAVEGLEVERPGLKPYVIPLSIAILLLLFLIQRRGTGRVGRYFGPVMVVWFSTLALLGLVAILREPSVLAAMNPLHAGRFFLEYRGEAFFALGAVILAITGVETLYADMGHFGRGAIRTAWLALVLPALLLNYFGQGAAILHDPATVRHPFFMLVPAWGLLPMVGLSAVATVIASQAVISGAYSLTRQAMQLGYTPRFAVRHTSEREIGQVYLPWINWALLAGVVGLVLGFGSSSNLAAAYGVAVTGTMVISTLLASVVIRRLWGWSRLATLLWTAAFLTVDLAFFGANFGKVLHGGWFPLLLAISLFTLLVTWKRGREILFDRLGTATISTALFLESIARSPPHRVPGTAVFLNKSPTGVPHALLHNLVHNKVLHERVLFLTVVTEEVPHVSPEERLDEEALGSGFFRLIVHYGFKDQPDIPEALARSALVPFELMETSFFLSRETLIPTLRPGMALWREKLFAWMAKNSTSAQEFFRIPTNRVVELGTQVEM